MNNNIRDIQFKMSDGLVLKGILEGQPTANDLVVMLHSGGYTRDEKGVSNVHYDENTGIKQTTYYNQYGNYQYLSQMLMNSACILRYDQRNHGKSGRNIDIEQMKNAILSIDTTIPISFINTIIELLLQNNKPQLEMMITTSNLSQNTKNQLNQLIKRPLIQDILFSRLKDDLKEVINQIQNWSSQMNGKPYDHIHFVGTCMGGLVCTLYLMENPTKGDSLTLFSPLFTLEDSFVNPSPQNEFTYKKRKAIYEGKQFAMGKMVEGKSTYDEIEKINSHFIKDLYKLNIPIFCIQGTDDALVPVDKQNQIFEKIEEYHQQNGLSDIYYAEITPGVHCLYNVIFPSLVEATEFIEGQIKNDKKLQK